MEKIGNIGDGGQSLSAGHKSGSTMKELFLAIRTELDALYAKLDSDFTAQNSAVTDSQLDVNYASTLPKFQE